MKDHLLKLLEKAIEDEKYAICKLLIDALVEIEKESQPIIYYPDIYYNYESSDEDVYEYIYNSKTN